MSALALHLWSDLVGLPYAELGRDRAGVDCWGLVRLAFAELAGVDLPSYVGDYLSTGERAEISALIGGAKETHDWITVSAERLHPFDVAVFRRGQLDGHVALVVDPARTLMLHVSSVTSSRAESWASGYWQPRLVGFWRHRELCP